MRNEDSNRSFIRSVPVVLTFFLLLGYFPLLRYPSPSLFNFFSNPTANGIYFLVLGSFFVIYLMAVGFHQKAAPPVRYLVFFSVFVIYALLTFFLHERHLSYTETLASQEVVTKSFDIAFSSSFIYAAELFYDLLFGFGFLFVWPLCKKEPRYQNVFPFTLVAIAFASAIYGFVRYAQVGVVGTGGYPVFTSFYSGPLEYGEILFAGIFAAFVLAYRLHGWQRWTLIGVGLALYLTTVLSAISLIFWFSSFALIIFALLLLTGKKPNQPSKKLKILAGCYLTFLILLLFMTLIPSPVGDFLKQYVHAEIVEVFEQRLQTWGNYLGELTSWRILLGDGVMGYYRYNILENGSLEMMALNNGFIEAFNAGGVAFLIFYLLFILVGFNQVQRQEGKDFLLLSLLTAFALIFLALSVFVSERLFFSSHYLSFAATFLFCCSTSSTKEEE